MFSLFKPAWQQANPEKRLEAIARLDLANPEQLAVLYQLALEDSEAGVRQVALDRVTDLDWLLDNSTNAEVSRKCLGFVLAMDAVPSASQLNRLKSSVEPFARVSLASSAKNRDLRHQFLEWAESSEQLLQIACESDFAETRQAAADRLQDEAHIRQVWQVAREKDKQLARNLDQRLNQMREAREQLEQATKKGEQLAQAMGGLADSSWSPQYNARFASLVQDWQELESQYPELPSQAYREAAIRAEAVVNSHRAMADAMRKRELLVEQVIQLTGQLGVESIGDDLLEKMLGQWQQLRREWVDCDVHSGATTEQQQRFDQLRTALQALQEWQHSGLPQVMQLVESTQAAIAGDAPANSDLKALLESVALKLEELKSWPLATPPESLRQALELLEELSTRLKTLRDEYQQKQQRCEKLIASIRRVVKEGNLQRAAGMRRKLDQQLEQLDTGQANAIGESVQRMDEELKALEDWKAFATLPKFEEYCESMETLAHNPLQPNKQIEAVRALQEAWKALKMNAPEALWERFQAAGHQAWQPCERWFEEQEAQRKANLDQRRELMQSLEQLLASGAQERPDWQAIRKAFRELTGQWRQCGPVPRNQQSKIQKSWSKKCKALQALLDKQYEANQRIKQALVEQAEAIASSADRDDATGQLKQLQQQWQQTGVVEPREERRLWKAFKEAGDKVFAHDRRIRDEQQAERKNRIQKIADQVDQLEKRLKAGEIDAEGILQAQQEIRGLQGDKRSGRDDRDTQGLSRRVSALAQQQQKLHQEKRQGKLREQWQRFLTLDRSGQLSGNESARLQQALQQRQTSSAEGEESARHLRQLRISVALLLGAETGEEDRELRMQLQMQRLQKSGVGAANQEIGQESLDQLMIDWLAVPRPEHSEVDSQVKKMDELLKSAVQKGYKPLV